MKIIIVCLDGLDYDAVISGGYANLIQREYGKVVVPILAVSGMPSSPMVWSSFLTGLPPTKHGVKRFFYWKNPLLEWSENNLLKSQLLSRIARKLRSPFSKLLSNFLNLEKRYISTDYLQKKKIRTIFDEIKPSIPLNIPAYNRQEGFELVEAIGNENKTKQLSESIYSAFEREKKLMFRKLNEDWNLFTVHFFVVDGYNHLFFNKQWKMLELYPELDELVSNIKARLPKDVFFLVISDHGSQNGLHTDYGFYSSNITLGLKNPHICDFYPLILRMAHVKEIRSLSEPVEKTNAKKTHYEYAEKDAEEIKKRLKELGYM